MSLLTRAHTPSQGNRNKNYIVTPMVLPPDLVEDIQRLLSVTENIADADVEEATTAIGSAESGGAANLSMDVVAESLEFQTLSLNIENRPLARIP